MASKTNLLAFPSRVAAPPAPPPTVAAREVTIASGLHSGAKFAVQDGDLIIVGADAGCDICLSDAGIAPRHAAIALHGPDVLIRSLDGAVSVNGESLRAARRLSSDESTVISLGTDEIRLELAATTATKSKTNRTTTLTGPSAKRRVIALLCFTVFAVVATVLVAGKLDASLSAKPAEPDVAAVQTLLDQQGFSKAVTASLASHGVEIKGVLDRAAATKLRAVTAGSRQPIVDLVITKEDLVEQVRDVFRTQGFDAIVTHVSGARVQIENLDESNERVRHAAEKVRTDVPQLEALTYISPKDAAPPSDPPPYGNGSGDRIVTRIDGKTAYLVAGAGTRYFTGSKLPSGQIIRRITREAVQVERDGQLDWFRF